MPAILPEPTNDPAKRETFYCSVPALASARRGSRGTAALAGLVLASWDGFAANSRETEALIATVLAKKAFGGTLPSDRAMVA
jgi:hypothetical protein